jgi:hypothetical protein
MTKNCVAGAVFMAAVFCFFYVGIVRWAALIFLRSFYCFIFLDLYQVGYHHLKQIAVFVFLHFVVNENPLITSCCIC